MTNSVSGSTRANPTVRTMVGADAFGVLLEAATAYLEVRDSAAAESELTATRVWVGLHGQATLQASLPWHPWPHSEQLADDIMTRLARSALQHGE